VSEKTESVDGKLDRVDQSSSTAADDDDDDDDGLLGLATSARHDAVSQTHAE